MFCETEFRHAHEGANSALLSEVMIALGKDEDEEDVNPTLQVHLHAAECSSVMGTMKAVVTGFVDSGGRHNSFS